MDKRTRKREAAAGTVICHANGQVSHGDLADISEHGCRLLGSGDEIKKGSEVVLTLPADIMISGTVRWATDEAIGVEFDATLHPAALRFVTRIISGFPQDNDTFDHFGRKLPPLGG